MKKKRIQFSLAIIISLSVLIYITYIFGWLSTLLITLSLLIILTDKNMYSNLNNLIAVIFVYLVKLTLSIINSFFFTIYGANKDAIGFFRNGKNIANSNDKIELINTGSDLFENYLAFCIRHLTANQFGLEMLSIFTFLIGLKYLLKIIKYIGYNKINPSIILLFGFLPSMLIYTTITMREPYEVTLFIMSTYYFIKGYKKGSPLVNIILFIVPTLFLGILHNGLLLFSIIVIALFSYIKIKELGIKINVFILFPIAIIIFYSFLIILELVGFSTVASSALLKGDILSYTEDFRNTSATVDARAIYGGGISTDNVIGFLISLPLLFFYYFVAPFPWQISSPVDIISILENLIRFYLFILIYQNWKKINSKDIKLILLLFLILEFIWAMGTLNWGTAARHHIVGFSLLLIVSYPYIKKISIRDDTYN